MRNRFAFTSNVVRFTKAVRAIETRAVPEAGIMVVAGESGLGKSRVGLWWALQHQAAHIECFTQVTPTSALRDLVHELGDTNPKRSAEALKMQAVGLLAPNPRPIVVDEVEHALARDAGALDALRQIADLCEVPLILIGREGTAEKLRRHQQLWTRIGAVAQFEAVTLADVRLVADELAEVTIADDVVEAVHAACGGRIRTALGGVAAAEKAGRGLGRPVTLADIDAAGARAALGHPWAGRDARITSLKARRRAPQPGAAVEPARAAAGGA